MSSFKVSCQDPCFFLPPAYRMGELAPSYGTGLSTMVDNASHLLLTACPRSKFTPSAFVPGTDP